MGINTKSEIRRQEAIAALRLILKPGDQVTTTVSSIAASGMSRTIRCQVVSPGWNYKGHDLVLNEDGQPRIIDISDEVAAATGNTLAKNGDVRISGCGMDMRFALVYALGSSLFPDGFRLADGQRGRNGDTTGFDRDGGYALNY